MASAAFVLFAQPLAVRGDEQDSVLEALQAGEVASLDRILARVKSAYRGRVLDSSLERNRGGGGSGPWVYEVTMLTPQGNVIMLVLDAKTTVILAVKGRGAEAARKQP